MTYIYNPTQEQRILNLLRKRGEKGVFVYEIMTPRPLGGLGIAQYTARIWGLRQKGHNIINPEKGKFILRDKYKMKPDWRTELKAKRLQERTEAMEEAGQGKMFEGDNE